MDTFLLILLVISCSFVAAVCATLLVHWTLVRLLRELEYRQTDLEGRLLREVKVRAGTVSREKRDTEEKLEQWAQEQKQAGPAGLGHPGLSYTDWVRGKMVGR